MNVENVSIVNGLNIFIDSLTGKAYMKESQDSQYIYITHRTLQFSVKLDYNMHILIILQIY